MRVRKRRPFVRSFCRKARELFRSTGVMNGGGTAEAD
jgi:hypothetical protein